MNLGLETAAVGSREMIGPFHLAQKGAPGFKKTSEGPGGLKFFHETSRALRGAPEGSA